MAPITWRAARAALTAQSSWQGPLSAAFPARSVCRGRESGARRWARIQVFELMESFRSLGWACQSCQ